MTSKRYKKLPEKTKELQAELIEKLIPVIKNNCTANSKHLAMIGILTHSYLCKP